MTNKINPEDMTRIFNWGVAIEDAIERIQSGVEGRSVVFPIERRRMAYSMSEKPTIPTMFYVRVEAVDQGYMP